MEGDTDEANETKEDDTDSISENDTDYSSESETKEILSDMEYWDPSNNTYRREHMRRFQRKD